jgi:hypothetical protein
MSWLILVFAIPLTLNLLVSAVALWKVWAIESRLGYGVSAPAEAIPKIMEQIQSAAQGQRRRMARNPESQMLRELADLDESC